MINIYFPGRHAFVSLLVIFCCLLSGGKNAFSDSLLVVGNSLTKHDPAPDKGWTGNWGMAASSADKDFVHLLVKKLEAHTSNKIDLSIIPGTPIENVFFNETDKKLLDGIDGTYDYIVLEIGDNIDFTNPLKDTFQDRYRDLIDKLKIKLGKNGVLVCLGKWWSNDVIDDQIRSACEAGKGKFVSLKPISSRIESKASHERQFTNAGVADHPGDWAMREISETVFCALTDCMSTGIHEAKPAGIGLNAVAKIQRSKMECAPVVPGERVPAVSALDKTRPIPPVVRGFQVGEFNSNSLVEMRRWGADVVRLQLIPGRWAVSMGKTFWEAWPLYLDKVERDVKEAKNAGLKVAPVLMGAPFTDTELQGRSIWQHPELEERFTRAWKDLATRLLPYKETIWGYDLFNEPLDRTQLPCPPHEWRPLAVKIIRSIRSVDPDTWIIFETGPGSLFSGFKGLVPLSDTHVIYSAHFYNPQAFTHQGIVKVQGTDLAKAMEKVNIRYPSFSNGVYRDKRQLEDVLKSADEFQAKWHVPIYVGEFSVVRWAPKESAVRWLRDVVDLFEARGWSWSYHAFREFNGWSLEHDEQFWLMGSPTGPKPVTYKTERAKVIKNALRKNLDSSNSSK